MGLGGRAFVAVGPLVALALSACISSATEATPATTTSPESTTSTTAVEVVTTIRLVPMKEFTSVGQIIVGELQYDFAFECWAAGAGDVLALGVGEDPESDDQTQAIVQAFLGQAYVSVLVGDDRVLELSIDQPADLFVQAGTIRGSALRFVDAQGDPGVGVPLGLGSVTVQCDGFAPGLPDGYEIGQAPSMER